MTDSKESFIFQMMCTMYQKCNLIHADLSEYNMLWHESNVYFIDVSQSVEPMHPHALEFLYRDCKNVTSFFERFGVEVMSAENLFNQVSKLDIPIDHEEGDFLSKVKNSCFPEVTMVMNYKNALSV